MTTKEVRQAIGYSQIRASVLANVSLNTWRAYEASPLSVSAEKRVLCDAARAQLELQLLQAATNA